MRPSTRKRRLLRLADRLDKTPRNKYNQDIFCESACCVAGHAILEFGTALQKRRFREGQVDPSFDVEYNIDVEAMKCLGLTWDEANSLFDTESSYPTEFKTRAGNVTPKLAAKRLRFLAETGQTQTEVSS